MKKGFFIFLMIVLSVGMVYPKGTKKLTERQAEIILFEKERQGLYARITEYEETIQNIKYRIAQLTFMLEYLEGKEIGKKKK